MVSPESKTYSFFSVVFGTLGVLFWDSPIGTICYLLCVIIALFSLAMLLIDLYDWYTLKRELKEARQTIEAGKRLIDRAQRYLDEHEGRS
jgi:hypothetical protein